MAFQRSPHFFFPLSRGFSITQSCLCVNPAAFVVTYLPVSVFALHHLVWVCTCTCKLIKTNLDFTTKCDNSLQLREHLKLEEGYEKDKSLGCTVVVRWPAAHDLCDRCSCGRCSCLWMRDFSVLSSMERICLVIPLIWVWSLWTPFFNVCVAVDFADCCHCSRF